MLELVDEADSNSVAERRMSSNLISGTIYARVVELVDTSDLRSGASWRVGSSPILRTISTAVREAQFAKWLRVARIRVCSSSYD